MLYKTLGDSGIKVPAIAQGTSGMGGYTYSDASAVEERIKAIRYGIDKGLTFIDTAELYGGGFAEETLGKAIVGIREKLFIASKFNPSEDIEKSFMNSLDGSLRRLKVDYIDLYQIHWPNPTLPLDRIMEALYRAVKLGKVRFVGVSNFPLQYLKDAEVAFKGKIVSNQVEYNLLDRSVEEDLLPYCTDEEISLLAYSPLNQGNILGGEEHREILESIAKKHKKTIPQVVIRWLVSHTQVIAVMRSKNINHVQDNVDLLSFDLDASDIERIDNLSREQIVSISLSSIRLNHPSYRKIYNSLEEATENRLDLIPSPSVLAQISGEVGNFKPIRVTLTKDVSGKYIYDIDQYDAMDQVKKYWAWKIAHGDEKPIPAFVLPKQKT